MVGGRWHNIARFPEGRYQCRQPANFHVSFGHALEYRVDDLDYGQSTVVWYFYSDFDCLVWLCFSSLWIGQITDAASEHFVT